MHIADQQVLLSALTPFGGVLKRGGHSCKDGVCARELTSVLREIPWSDDPDRSPFDRWAWALNDAAWSSDQVRTDQMLWAAGIDGNAADAAYADAYAAAYARDEILALAVRIVREEIGV